MEAAPSLAEVPLVTETLAAVFLPGDDLPLSAVETSGDEEMVAAGMPESSLADMDNVPLPDTAEAGLTAAAAAAGLAAWLDQAAALPDAAPQADALAEAEVVPWEASPPVAESAATGTDMGIVATEPVPELTAGSEVPLVTMLDEVPPDLVAAPAGADIAAAGMPQPAPDEAIAATEVTASDGPMADAACPAGDAVAEEGAVTLELPLLSEPEALPPATGTTAPAAAMDEEPEGDEFAFDLAAAEGAAPVGVAAAYVTALETLPDEAGDDATVHGYPLGRSIPLDSLPTGVLGGGLGLAADLVAGLESDKAGAAVPDREVELAWARDLGAEPPFDLTTQDAILPLQQPLVVPAAMAMPAETGLAAATMQLSGIKEVSQPQVPAPETAPGEAQSPLDAEALTDALYARVLPRMKVELTLWMQDALEMQARQLMSGVMQHLKEDFDMMLAEALRESLREAIREAQAGQGEEQ
ncbi:hypothetical protein ACFSQE_08600 [Vogesella fluminis]|uniref:hypothetical protein n=1 Tax=Vogesella fluminis TaxID=1069161 RepID=UPI003645CA26